MDLSTFYPAIVGGCLIGVTSMTRFLLTGSPLGISGISGKLVKEMTTNQKSFMQVLDRITFTAGLVGGGVIGAWYAPERIQLYTSSEAGVLITLIVSGFLVGVGSNLQNGCTSGHGISGLSRFSPRSLVAVCMFMFTGVLTSTIMNTDYAGVLETASSSSTAAANADGLKILGVVSLLCAVGSVAMAYIAGGSHKKSKASTTEEEKQEELRLLNGNNSSTKNQNKDGKYVAERAMTEGMSGLAFGLALVLSGMTDPARVTAFLNFNLLKTGEWEPSLLFVMGCGICVGVPLYHFVIKPLAFTKTSPTATTSMYTPLLSDSGEFGVPCGKNWRQPKLILGAALFGAGWGLGGMCPGPAIVSMGATLGNSGQLLNGGLWCVGFFAGQQVH